MPELPEVEAVVRALRDGGRRGGEEPIVGRRVAQAQVLSPRVLVGLSPEDLAHAVEGARIADVQRRGKWILLSLDEPGLVLAVHLRMTGDLVLAAGDERYVRLRLLLDDGRALVLDDPRHLGEVRVLERPEEVTGDLGPDPFEPALDADALRERIGRGRRTLKAALLDQRVLAGVGNIWADEALFEARLPPTLTTAELDDESAARLLAAVRTVLTRAVAHLTRDGIGWLYRGRREDAEAPGVVYGRAGEPCVRCGTPIEQTRVAGRATYFCPRCQARAVTAPAARRR